jgi:DNA replication protein DnaC
MANIQSLPLLLKELRLTAIAKSWPDLADKSVKEAWEPTQFLAELCDLETNHRYEHRLKRLLKESQLPTGKQLSQYDLNEIKGVTALQLQQKTIKLDWIRQGHNFILFSASGLGKTHLAAAVGHALIAQSIRVKFTSSTALLQQLQKPEKCLALKIP